jgi:hypothetical protein
MIPSAEFSSMEATVFARYALSPKICHLSLAKPTLAVRAYELGKGEPLLFIAPQVSSWPELRASTAPSPQRAPA